MNIKAVYFSATYTTRRVVRSIAEQIGGNIVEYDITTQSPSKDVVSLGVSDLSIFGMPVYAGRIPATALVALNRFMGEGTPAIIVCVYGNREYDDALLELKDVVESNGFKVISAGAFIAQHSIFVNLASDRPDEADMGKIHNFAQQSAALLSQLKNMTSIPSLNVRGNMPYKQPGVIHIHPLGDNHCNRCGVCVRLCPAGAIVEEEPAETDTKRCISCGRCVVVCPIKCRSFSGMLYQTVASKIVGANLQRKEPEVFMLSL